jgi:hypothetical protein
LVTYSNQDKPYKDKIIISLEKVFRSYFKVGGLNCLFWSIGKCSLRGDGDLGTKIKTFLNSEKY